MIWQDLVFLIGGFIGAGFLLPTLVSNDSTVPATTSILQVGLITTFAFTFWTLNMPLSALGALTRSLAWIGIALFRRSTTQPSTPHPQ